MIRLMLTYVLLIIAIMVFPQAKGPSPEDLVLRVQKSGPDTGRIAALQNLGRYYLDRAGLNKNDQDSALLLFNQAMLLSRQTHHPAEEITASKNIAEVHLHQGKADQAERELQEQELQKSAQARKFTYAFAGVLIVLTGVGYSRYRLKQKSNSQLQEQQKEINSQYQALRKLNATQEKLLVEKEYLVKEIHHRVKNNLQIVISLLNAQSDFLDHPSALHAIRESRERMQAIALIHQKLYQPDQNMSISMNSY